MCIKTTHFCKLYMKCINIQNDNNEDYPSQIVFFYYT